MNKLPMSRAASSLLRALLDRTKANHDRILLTEIQSCDWQSLTLTGERHVINLRVRGPDAGPVARSLTKGLEDAEFAISGQIVADIAATLDPLSKTDGSITLSIEALTIAE
jgi:hypothetical protein